jgi:Tol biopolymer transport system component
MRSSYRASSECSRGSFLTSTVAILVAAATFFMAGPVQAAPPAGRILYSDVFGGSGLYAIGPDGTGRFHVLDEPVYRPHWVPQAPEISFIVNGRRIDAVDSDGTNRRVIVGRHELPTGWKRVSDYAWSPDGSQLVLCLSDDRYNHTRTFVASSNGSTVTQIALNACASDWSSQDRILVERGLRLIAMDPDGTNVDVIYDDLKAFDPSWSPDGSQLAFMCGVYRHADVCVVSADGTGVANLTNSRRIDWSPSWSPDGSRIAWAPATNTCRRFADLWRMRADGSAKTRLTDTPRIDEYEPDWTDAT